MKKIFVLAALFAFFANPGFAQLTFRDVSVSAGDVSFSDADSNFTATDVDSALSEFDDVDDAVNDGDGKVDWSQLENVPAGFADGTDDGAGGSSEWTDTGTVVHPTETGDDVALGNSTLVNSAKLSIDGDADQVQLTIQGHSTQTSNLVILEQSDGTEVVTITNAGVVTAQGFSGALTGAVTGNADTATALAANGANCSAGQVPLGVDASGAAEGCLDVWTEAENTSAAYIANVSEDTTPQLGGDLDSNTNNIVLSTGTAIQTGTTATNTALLQAYDVDGAAYVTFATLTAANTPTFDLASGTTLGGAAIQTGTDDDVPESGDFGAAGDLEADGTLSADVVAAAEMADADHGDISWSSGVASIDSGVVGGAELADAITLDATTTIDMDSNTADLNFDSDTLFIDQSTNRVGIGTSTPSTALHVNGDLTAANVDFTDSMTMPSGTNPTVDAVGKVALDTSASQIVYYDGSAVRVLGYELSDFVVIESLAAADDNLPIGTRSYARTITSVGCRCIGTCTTPAQISLEDTGGNAMTHTTPTCATTGAVTYQSVTAGGGLTAGEGLVFDVDNTPSPETDTYEILWTETRDRQ